MEYLSVRLAAVESGLTGADGAAEATADVTGEEMAGQDTGQTGGIETVQNTAAGGKVESAYSGIDTDNNIEGSRRELWLHIAGILWLFGVLIAVFRKIYIYQHFAGAVRAASAPVTDDRVYRKSAEIQMRLGLGRGRTFGISGCFRRRSACIGSIRFCMYLTVSLIWTVSWPATRR